MSLKLVLKELLRSDDARTAYIPSLWIGKNTNTKVNICYREFLIKTIQKILKHPVAKVTSKNVDWTEKAMIYNIFVRFFTAYDHNQDGILGSNGGDITLNQDGLRETGTFLKTIALLPYLKALGINTIHLLPITKIGEKGRKGDMGSPYAIKNPFDLDPNLTDPIIDITAEDQYKALVESAHRLNIRVVQEFIFRTASIDSDWTISHPEWFYWVNDADKYAAPIFSRADLIDILKVPRGQGKFIPPPKKYRDLFRIPSENRAPKNARVASAFADWPPDDLQPPWIDVTYLRLFNYDFHKSNNYNYIAYNTIRYYDPDLSQAKNINHELWENITSIIPFYQRTFDIDGAMIDMGHALPHQLKSKIIEKARKIDQNFAFWDENFDNKLETKNDGYNAVIGDYWYKITKRNGFRNIILESQNNKPLYQFGTSETHNSPRFGFNQIQKKKTSWLLFNLLPNTIPFVHNGFELNEGLPVNTGLNFSEAQIDRYSRQPLPLFYKNAMDWDINSQIIPFIKKLTKIKKKHAWIFNSKKSSLLLTTNKKVLGFEIVNGRKKCIALINTNFYRTEVFKMNTLYGDNYFDLMTDKQINLNEIDYLRPGGFTFAIALKSSI